MIVERVLQTHPRDVLAVRPNDTVQDVARLFEKKRSGIAMVCAESERLIGVVSLATSFMRSAIAVRPHSICRSTRS